MTENMDFVINENMNKIVLNYIKEENNLTEKLLEKYDYNLISYKNTKEYIESFFKIFDEKIFNIQKIINEDNYNYEYINYNYNKKNSNFHFKKKKIFQKRNRMISYKNFLEHHDSNNQNTYNIGKCNPENKQISNKKLYEKYKGEDNGNYSNNYTEEKNKYLRKSKRIENNRKNNLYQNKNKYSDFIYEKNELNIKNNIDCSIGFNSERENFSCIKKIEKKEKIKLKNGSSQKFEENKKYSTTIKNTEYNDKLKCMLKNDSYDLTLLNKNINKNFQEIINDYQFLLGDKLLKYEYMICSNLNVL